MTISQANLIISANPTIFVPGAQFSQATLCQLVNITAPNFLSLNSTTIIKRAQAFQLDKLTAYCTLNRVLRPLGRVIKQVGLNYHVTTIEESQAVIKSYQRRASVITRNAAILSSGVQSSLVFTGVSE